MERDKQEVFEKSASLSEVEIENIQSVQEETKQAFFTTSFKLRNERLDQSVVSEESKVAPSEQQDTIGDLLPPLENSR